MIKFTVSQSGFGDWFNEGETVLFPRQRVTHVVSYGNGSKVSITDMKNYLLVRETPEQILEMMK